MFLHVLEARYIRDYAVWLRFSDGAAGEVDLEEELEGPIFGPLRDIERFRCCDSDSRLAHRRR